MGIAMCPGPDSEKMDALDLVIGVLKEHEKNLDRLAERLEAVAERLEKAPERPSEVRFERWADFRKRCRGAGAVTFETGENGLAVSAVSGGRLYRHVISFSRRRERLDCGLEVSTRVHVDSDEVKSWLSRELNVSKKNIRKKE